jgi:hypothetical protein
MKVYLPFLMNFAIIFTERERERGREEERERERKKVLY